MNTDREFGASEIGSVLPMERYESLAKMAGKLFSRIPEGIDVWAFGSYVDGNVCEPGDIDLALLVQPGCCCRNLEQMLLEMFPRSRVNDGLGYRRPALAVQKNPKPHWVIVHDTHAPEYSGMLRSVHLGFRVHPSS